MRLSSTSFAKTEFRTETSALPVQLLLGILDKATLTLGDDRRVDLSQTVIFLTSNLGGAQIADLMQGGMGFVQPAHKSTKELGDSGISPFPASGGWEPAPAIVSAPPLVCVRSIPTVVI
jgi:hypothetical protein